MAEDSGLIGELTAWVLEQACRQLILWDQVGFRIPRLAVNLPMREIERTDLVNRVRRTLERTGLAPDRLELEVTESMIMRRPDVAITTLDALRALGVILALDDFGTGHSSLTYPKRLPLNRLTMDKSFVERLGEDRDDEAIARAVIALGRTSDSALSPRVSRPARRTIFCAANCAKKDRVTCMVDLWRQGRSWRAGP